MAETEETKSPNFINAFQLIAMSNDLDLSGLFEGEVCKKLVISCFVMWLLLETLLTQSTLAYLKDNVKQRTRFGSKHSIHETIESIEVAAKDVRLSVEKMNNSKVTQFPAFTFPCSYTL